MASPNRSPPTEPAAAAPSSTLQLPKEPPEYPPVVRRSLADKPQPSSSTVQRPEEPGKNPPVLRRPLADKPQPPSSTVQLPGEPAENPPVVRRSLEDKPQPPSSTVQLSEEPAENPPVVQRSLEDKPQMVPPSSNLRISPWMHPPPRGSPDNSPMMREKPPEVSLSSIRISPWMPALGRGSPIPKNPPVAPGSTDRPLVESESLDKPPVAPSIQETPPVKPHVTLGPPKKAPELALPAPPAVVTSRLVRDDPPSALSKAAADVEGDGEKGSRVVKRIVRGDRIETALRLASAGLRIMAAVVAMIAFSVMVSDRTDGWAGDSFGCYAEYRYLVTVNVIVFVYSLFQVYARVHRKIMKRDIIRGPYQSYFDFSLDQILAYLLMSASSAAATRNDDWVSAFGRDKFTDQASAAIAMSFLAFFTLALSSIISVDFLFDKTSHPSLSPK